MEVENAPVASAPVKEAENGASTPDQNGSSEEIHQLPDSSVKGENGVNGEPILEKAESLENVAAACYTKVETKEMESAPEEAATRAELLEDVPPEIAQYIVEDTPAPSAPPAPAAPVEEAPAPAAPVEDAPAPTAPAAPVEDAPEPTAPAAPVQDAPAPSAPVKVMIEDSKEDVAAPASPPLVSPLKLLTTPGIRTSSSSSSPRSPTSPKIRMTPVKSTESHDNPFLADGELSNKADSIIRHSTISRTQLKVYDPDTTKEPEPVEEAIEAKAAGNTNAARPQDVNVGPGGKQQNGGVEDGLTPQSVEVEVAKANASQPEAQKAEEVKVEKDKKCACCVIQ